MSEQYAVREVIHHPVGKPDVVFHTHIGGRPLDFRQALELESMLRAQHTTTGTVGGKRSSFRVVVWQDATQYKEVRA